MDEFASLTFYVALPGVKSASHPGDGSRFLPRPLSVIPVEEARLEM